MYGRRDQFEQRDRQRNERQRDLDRQRRSDDFGRHDRSRSSRDERDYERDNRDRDDIRNSQQDRYRMEEEIEYRRRANVDLSRNDRPERSTQERYGGRNEAHDRRNTHNGQSNRQDRRRREERIEERRLEREHRDERAYAERDYRREARPEDDHQFRREARPEDDHQFRREARPEDDHQFRREARPEDDHQFRREARPEDDHQFRREARPEDDHQFRREARPEDDHPFRREARPEDDHQFRREARPEDDHPFRREARPEDDHQFRREARPEDDHQFRREARPEDDDPFRREARPEDDHQFRREARPEDDQIRSRRIYDGDLSDRQFAESQLPREHRFHQSSDMPFERHRHDLEFDRHIMENDMGDRRQLLIRHEQVQDYERPDYIPPRLIDDAEHERKEFGRVEHQGRIRHSDIPRDRSPLRYPDEENIRQLRRQRLIEEAEFLDRRNHPENRRIVRDERFFEEELGHQDEREGLTKMFESQIEKAKISLLRQRVANQNVHLDPSERAEMSLQDSSRDGLSLVARSQRGLVIANSRNGQRIKMRRNPPGRLPAQLSGELDLINSHGFDQDTDPDYDQVLNEETDIIEEDFDEGVHPILEQGQNQQRNPRFQEMLSDETHQLDLVEQDAFEDVDDDKSFALSVTDRLQHRGALNIGSENFQPMVNVIENEQRLRRILQMQGNLQPIDSNIVSKQRQMQLFGKVLNAPMVSRISDMSPNIGALQVVRQQLPNTIQVPQVSQIRENLGVIASRPNIGGNFQPGFGGIPQRSGICGNIAGSGIGGIPNMSGIGGIPQRSGIAGNILGPGICGIPQRSGIAGNITGPGISGIPQRSGIGGNILGPGIGGIFQSSGIAGNIAGPGIGGIPQKSGIGGNISGPGIGGIPQRSGIGGNILGPGIGGIPQRSGIDQNIARPGIGGIPQRSGIGGNISGPNIGGIVPIVPMGPSFQGNGRNPQEANQIFNKEFTDQAKMVGDEDLMDFNQMPYNEDMESNNMMSDQAMDEIQEYDDTQFRDTGNPNFRFKKKGYKKTNKRSSSNLLEMPEPKTIIKYQASMKCPVCPHSQSFENESEFHDHWKMFHVKVREKIFCPVEGCDSFASTSLKLQEHFKREHHKGPMEMSVNNLQKLCLAKKEMVDNPLYRDPGNMIYGIKEEDTKVEFSVGMKCPVCLVSPTFENVQALSEHWEVFHIKFQKKFFCTSAGCKVFLPSLDKLKKHYWKEHNYGNDELTLAAMETLDEARYKIMKNDLFVDPGQYVFDGCQKTLEVQFEPGMTCPICPAEILSTLMEYQQHWQKIHVEFYEFLLCPVEGCDGFASKAYKLRQHFNKQHNPFQDVQALTILKSAIKETKPNIHYKDPGNCIFTSFQDNKNVSEFSFEEGMKCPACICPKTFKIENEFFIHWMSHTEYFYKYACPFPECTVTKSLLSKLRTHISKDHMNSARLTGKLLDQVSNLQAVMVENPTYISDPGIHKYVRDLARRSLDRNPNAVPNESGEQEEITFEKGMVCPVCKGVKKYLKPFDFRNHWIMSHVEFYDRQFCPFEGCNMPFSSLKLKAHYRKKHMEFEDGDDVCLMLEDVPLKKMKNPSYISSKEYMFDYQKEEIRVQDIHKRIPIQTEGTEMNWGIDNFQQVLESEETVTSDLPNS